MLHSEPVSKLIAIMKEFIENQELRYARVDFLFWYQFQNRCSEIFLAIVAYLDQFKLNTDIKLEDETELKRVLDMYVTMITTLFDLLNCDKLHNVVWFSLCDDINKIFTILFNLKLVGVELQLSRTIELFDYLLILGTTSKKSFKFESPNSLKFQDLTEQMQTSFLQLCSKLS